MSDLSRSRRILSRLGVGIAALVIVIPGVATADNSDSAPRDPDYAPSSQPAAGPEAVTKMAGSRPVSGRNPSAGPKFTETGGVWSVITPEVILRNTVTDADGDRSTLSFEVWKTDAAGTPTSKVPIDNNEYGVKVSDYVDSGSRAKVTVEYGYLKPGVNYAFRTSGFDGSLYETDWSPFAHFRIDPYATFPSPQASSTIDSLKQPVREIFRSDPGPVFPADTVARGSQARKCGAPDAKGRKLCMEITPPSSKSKKQRAAMAAPAVDLVNWCSEATSLHDYMNRTEACLKNVGTVHLIFWSLDPQEPALGTAKFDIEQRIKAYPKKGDSGSDFGEFDQQVVLVPRQIDPALQGVRLQWNVGHNCSSCVMSQTQWKDNQNNNAEPHWNALDWTEFSGRWGTQQTTWSGAGKETIDLSWSLTGSVDVSDAGPLTLEFGSTGTPERRELAPRCDDILKGVAPGCALASYTPMYTVDTNLYPAAGAYYWYMQLKMAHHNGRGDEPLHYLGPDTKVKNPATGQPWTNDDSRGVVCPTGWLKHEADASLGELSCDEFAMATTHESGGFPGGPNQVASGDECAQLYTDRMGTGTAFGLLADTRTDLNGPGTTGKVKCGRASLSKSQNTQAFSKLQPSVWRLLDDDAFYVSNPGFEHCTTVDTPCAWRSIS